MTEEEALRIAQGLTHEEWEKLEWLRVYGIVVLLGYYYADLVQKGLVSKSVGGHVQINAAGHHVLGWRSLFWEGAP